MVLCPDVYSLILGLALHADVPENCAFDAADSFSEGMAEVVVGEKHGYINKAGEIVIKPRFGSGSHRFFEGLALVRVGEKYGYINKSGEIVIAPDYRAASPFSEGLAKVYLGDDMWGYIGRIGNPLR